MNPKTFDGHNTLWVIHIGNSDRVALRARDEGFVAIGWAEMGDLARYTTREQVKQAMSTTWPSWKRGKVAASFGQVYRFAHEIQNGDPVVFPIKATREIALGRITSEYVLSEDQELTKLRHPNVRKVKWLKIVPRTEFSKAALHSFGSFSTVSTSNDFFEEFLGVLATKKHATEKATNTDVEADAGEEDEEAFDLYGTAVQETEDYLLKEWHRTGAAFEHVVAAVVESIGFTTTVTQASNDHGVDVIAHPDPLGLSQPFIKIQAKSGTTTIGEPDINQLLGSLQSGEKGVFVSLGGFSRAAKAKARNCSNLTLIDAKKFVSLFLDHYENLSPVYRAKYPLSHVYVPQRILE